MARALAVPDIDPGEGGPIPLGWLESGWNGSGFVSGHGFSRAAMCWSG
jgi:hypothetical protein